ncbi:hypothetical protein FMUND_10952 [Fusarium mundagurra]|uniref:Apple domain-containing protein n=1 Tax=Fusarium mundagurra TaxID=1567541 RepID=A0A8H5Y8Y2_9HYPO|nr:hypothetical protein FMUND_10952 [Fusarium mundagurra]
MSTEVNSLSSSEPSGTVSESPGSAAFTTTSPQVVDTSAFASSPIFGSVLSTITSHVDGISTSAPSSVSATGAISTVSSHAISLPASTSGFGTSTLVSSELIESSVTAESSIVSSESSTKAPSSTEQEESSLLTTTSNETTDMTSTTFGSTSEASSEPASSDSSDTSSSAEETSSDQSTASDSSTTIAESSTEITTTATEASTTTTELMTTTTTAAPQSECQMARSPYTVQGVNFNLSCDSVITGDTSVGVAPTSSFNQCVYYCAVYSACVDVHYERATGPCSGFSSMTRTSANSNFDAAIRI